MAQEQPQSAPDSRGGALPGPRRGAKIRVQSTFEGRVVATFSVLLAVASLLLGENLVFLMACLALGFLVAARLLARWNLRGVDAHRQAPRRARAGAPFAVRYALANPRRRGAVGVELQDRPGATFRPVEVAAEFPYVEGRGTARHASRLVGLRRGRHGLPRLRLRSRFPLGLFEASRPVGDAHELLIRPREGRATARLAQLVAGRTSTRRRPSALVVGPDAFHGVREYREGDDPRRIHWRTTARTGALTLAQWHRDEGLELVVVLGRGRGVGGVSARDFERAVSVAATLLRLAARRRLKGTLHVGTPNGRVAVEGAASLDRALDVLAQVGPQAGRRPRAVLRRLATRSRGQVVVFVASTPEPGIAARLRAAAGPGGSALLLRADQPSLAQWVGGLP